MALATWGWRRWISPGSEDTWISRLQDAGCPTWTLTERPDHRRILLAVYSDKRESAIALRDLFGGIVRAIKQSDWLPTKPAQPTRISERLEIVHAVKHAPRSKKTSLHIPHGLAFGSGEHATTFMLLRALTQAKDWCDASVLDIGTGSGVLALATRLFGARKIVATDFDAEAVRTARQNEALNFSTRFIRWQRADVRKLNAKDRYNLVIANLFSGILCETASRIAACVAPDGQLWLSGILHTQKDEVIAAYRARGLELIAANRRGKWIVLQWSAPLRPKPSRRKSSR